MYNNIVIDNNNIHNIVTDNIVTDNIVTDNIVTHLLQSAEMLSKKELLYNGDLYQPLSTMKSIRNKANIQPYTQVSMLERFYSPENKEILATSLYNTSRANGYNATITVFQNNIETLMKRFCATVDIAQYEMAENSSCSSYANDWALALRGVNNDFLRYCYRWLKWNILNPFRATTVVGASDNRIEKKYSDLLAADIPTIDVWQAVDINIMAKNFRDHNKIPFYQRTMATRNFDRSGSDGYRTTLDRASLDTPIYAYDQSPIYKVISNWTESGWVGL